MATVGFLSLAAFIFSLQPRESVADGRARPSATTAPAATSAPAAAGRGGVSPDELIELRKLLENLKPMSPPFGPGPVAPGQTKTNPQRARDLVSRMSDPQLREFLLDPAHTRMMDAAGPDYGLAEVIRRGGKEWETFLAERLKEAAAAREAARKSGDGGLLELRDLGLLTALRRVQGKNDPLLIVLAGNEMRQIKPDEDIKLHVCLTNVDEQRTAFQFTQGGDYRSGRQARWRVQVRDAQGRELPAKPFTGGMGGGLYTTGTLEYGESWATRLVLSSFVDMDMPGEYTARILYHNHLPIADYNEIEGLIVSKSTPFKISVEPVTVSLSDKRRREIAGWIGQLPNQEPVKIVEGRYGKWTHDFIEPQGPAGRLLATGWEAVPELIKAATAEATPALRRAWVLSILYGITGRHDPREVAGVVGAYQARSGWVVRGGYAEGAGVMGGGSGSSESFGGTIDAKKQLEFAARWKEWIHKGYIKIEAGP